jgi:hypothetical protein
MNARDVPKSAIRHFFVFQLLGELIEEVRADGAARLSAERPYSGSGEWKSAYTDTSSHARELMLMSNVFCRSQQ